MMQPALVHDWLNQYGGAERVLEQLVSMYPHSPVYTSMYWREGMPSVYQQWDIRTTWLDRLPGIYKHHQLYFPLYALAFSRLRIPEAYDIVITNKSGFCHGVQQGTRPQLCYCLAPTRYVWQFDAYAAREQLAPALRVLLKPLIAWLRRWDYRVAQRTNIHYVAISQGIQERISSYYGRESEIVYPPVDISRFQPAKTHDDYYLIVSRLIPYKRIDLAVKAFSQLGLPLVIAGDGRDRGALQQMAGPAVKFLGRVPDTDLPELYARCKAFVFPGEEDFGMTPVEAQASGRPVIAYRAGGAMDTVVDGVTGTFFAEATVESLKAAISGFDADRVDPQACTQNAARFGVHRFVDDFNRCLGRLIN